jgi:hypothetical protein
MRAAPIIIPVSYTLLEDDIAFSPGFDPKLARAVSDAVVAFETDRVGPDGRAQWDVHVIGVARMLEPPTDPPRFRVSSELMTGWRQAS